MWNIRDPPTLNRDRYVVVDIVINFEKRFKIFEEQKKNKMLSC